VISEVLEKQIYKLFGVVVHSGTMSGGHYVAYVRHQEQYTIDNNLRGEDHWFYYSDTTYKEVPLRNVLNA
jgi:ubiquitin carboxyl-terminal hydrolase 16/45